MPRFLAESYVVSSEGAFAEACALARRTAEIDADIRYVDTTYVPRDETALHLFDAPSLRALERAGRLAGLPFDRIVEAVHETGEDPRKETTR